MLGLPIATFAIAANPPSTQASTGATAILVGVGASPAVGSLAALAGARVSLVGVAASPAVGVLAASASVALATSTTVRVVGLDGLPRSGLSGLRWAFFDAHTLDQLRAPTAQGVGATTDSGGNLTVSISGTALLPGAFGYLAFSDGNGSLTQTPPANAFLGLVQVQ